ncbi:MAG: class I SAM-dependent RNA methyltransferase [Myxococcota bacterium]
MVFRTADAFVVTAPGLEQVLAAELTALGAGAPTSIERGGVAIRVDRPTLYRIHLHARVAVRVWVRLGRFRAANLDQLGAAVRKLAWPDHVHPRQAVEVKIASSNSRIQGRGGAQRKVEVAIRDANRVPRRDPGRPPTAPAEVLVRIDGDDVEVSIDASGERLNRRGWRRDTTEAPLRETLAAAVLDLAEWSADEPLVDPMCGSGTFPIEAATIARGIPPGSDRTFAFEAWPTHDRALWDALRAEPIVAVGRPVIRGSDLDPGAIRAARDNARRAHVELDLRVSAVDAVELPPGPGLIVANPPYGARLRGASAVWESLGRWARERAIGWRIALVVPDPALLRLTGLELPRIARFDNGGIPVALHAGPGGAARAAPPPRRGRSGTGHETRR